MLLFTHIQYRVWPPGPEESKGQSYSHSVRRGARPELGPGLRPGQESYAALLRVLTQQLVDAGVVQEWMPSNTVKNFE